MTDINTPTEEQPAPEQIWSREDRPRPPTGGTGLLTPDQSRTLAQQSLDAGGDPAALKAALAADGIEWEPDTRTKADRAWSDDHARGHGERYSVPADRYFPGDAPQEREAVADVVRNFLATVGMDREGGSELAETLIRTMADRRGDRPETRTQYQHEQLARLGSKAGALVADAAKALQGVHPDVLALLHKSGALDNADVIAQLAFMGQARAARG